VAIMVCGRHGCGRHCLWPSWFVAVIVEPHVYRSPDFISGHAILLSSAENLSIGVEKIARVMQQGTGLQGDT